MNRVVLDTNIIVSALLVPAGTQASVLLLALEGQIALYISHTVLAEYEEVLRRPRLKATDTTNPRGACRAPQGCTLYNANPNAVRLRP